MNDKRIWTLGALLAAVVLLLGGYFLGVAPQLEAAAQADSQRKTVEAQNDALVTDIAVLKGDYENLDKFKSQLAEVSQAIPDNADFSRYIAQLNELSAVNTVAVTSVTVGDALAYAGPVNAQALALPMGVERRAQEAAARAALTGDANDVALAATLEALTQRVITEPVVSDRVTPQNFVAIPITIQASGDYDRLLDFVAALQNGTRLTLVTGLGLSPNNGETIAAPYTANISAYVYVLINDADAPADPAVAAAEAEAEAEAAAAAE